jgi:hypothetical protein
VAEGAATATDVCSRTPGRIRVESAACCRYVPSQNPARTVLARRVC